MVELSSPLLVAFGALALVAAFIGRELVRLRRRARLLANLSSPNPAERIESAKTLLSGGLAAAAGPLLDALGKEDDPEVRLSIALTIGCRQWEPGKGRGAAALRDRASAELVARGFEVTAFGPAHTRMSDMGGPRLPDSEHSSSAVGKDRPPPTTDKGVEAEILDPEIVKEVIVDPGFSS